MSEKYGDGGVSRDYIVPPHGILENPYGWIKTPRPCPKCNAVYTWIDEFKIWHCQSCGWTSVGEVDMARGKIFTDDEIKIVIEMYNMKYKHREIAEKLGRQTSSIHSLVERLKKTGAIPPDPRPKGGFREDKKELVIPVIPISEAVESSVVSMTEEVLRAKPPIGLTPRYIKDEERIREIALAVSRFLDAKKEIPAEWIEEWNEILARIA